MLKRSIIDFDAKKGHFYYTKDGSKFKIPGESSEEEEEEEFDEADLKN